jgi:hypothetical protein
MAQKIIYDALASEPFISYIEKAVSGSAMTDKNIISALWKGKKEELTIMWEDGELSAPDKLILDGIVQDSLSKTQDDVTNEKPLLDFLDSRALVTDPQTGVQGPFDLMQIMINRREIFNDEESPLHIQGFTPLVGPSGSVQNLNNIHGKNGWHNQQVKESSYRGPESLLIYYGYMNSFNSALTPNSWDNEKVAQDMAKYSVIVLGNGVQDPGHADYANTQIIIPRIKQLRPGVKIFGYVSTNQDLADFQSKVDQWETLGVSGIFMDESGYDYGKYRSDFNIRVDYVHSQDNAKLCFANAWNLDHILGTVDDPSFPNATYNVSGDPSALNQNDWVLLESSAVNTSAYSANGGCEDGAQWFARMSKAATMRSVYGINVAASSVISNGNAQGNPLSSIAQISAMAFCVDAFGTSDVNYGSNGAVEWWPKIDPSPVGKLWSLYPSIAEASGVYYRYLEFGRIKIDFNAGSQAAMVEVW